jgi:undecaprenyl-phosphate galactose phosphotransferase/putative colanic acid biosynthesis UDP-glucose lipid carrier transferase
MSDLAQITKLRQSIANSPSFIRLSYHQIGLYVALIDAALIFCASILANLSYHYLLYDGALDLEFGAGTGLVACAVFWLVARPSGLYSLPHLIGSQPRWSAVFLSWGAVVLVLPLLLFLLKVGNVFSRGSMVIFAFLGLMLLVGFRIVASFYLRRFMAKGHVAGRRAVVVGEAGELAALSAANLLYRFGIEEVGRVVVLEDTGEQSSVGRSDGFTAQIDHAIDLARDSRADEFAVALNWGCRTLLKTAKERLRYSPLPARLLPDRNIRSMLRGRHLFKAADFSIELQREPLTKIERGVKRLVDLCVASALLALLSPLLIVVAGAIKFDSPGPVIFRQRRRGFNGREFLIYKFRSMHVLEDGAVIAQASKRDARVTDIGRLLRQSSIDELPQLFNVLKGEMSLIGPRPHAVAHDQEYGELISNYAFRHHVKPGITGLAQINGCRGETSQLHQMKKRIDYDLWYIDNWSFVLDLQILMRTTLVPLSRDAY